MNENRPRLSIQSLTGQSSGRDGSHGKAHRGSEHKRRHVATPLPIVGAGSDVKVADGGARDRPHAVEGAAGDAPRDGRRKRSRRHEAGGGGGDEEEGEDQRPSIPAAVADDAPSAVGQGGPDVISAWEDQEEFLAFVFASVILRRSVLLSFRLTCLLGSRSEGDDVL